MTMPINIIDHFDFAGADFFGLKLGRLMYRGWPSVIAAQAFRRKTNELHVQGASLLQVRKRHLVYIGGEGGELRLCVGFIWFTRGAS
jgi:hypothetical protein